MSQKQCTSGIIGVHTWGHPCHIQDLTDIARKHKLKLLFDAAHAFGCEYEGQAIGNFGDAEVFSFHATKFINSFEGGAIVTNNDELATKIRLMKNFGFSGYDNVIYIGTNGKMSEVSAAMGLTSLESLEEFIALNRQNYDQYAQELSDLPGISLFSYKQGEKSNYQYIVLEIEPSITGISRDLIMSILHAENVLARRYFYPGCHRMEPYRSQFPYHGLILPETEKLTEKVLILPTGTSTTTEDISCICDIIRCGMKYGKEISAKIDKLPPLKTPNPNPL
jgi:dTDP-4-amino-4,6-dideoxygalactose transaminase